MFGFDVAFEAPPADADAETKEAMAFLFGGVIYTFGGGLLGLRPVAPAMMSMTRTGSASTT